MTIRANKNSEITESKHQNQLMFVFVLSGAATLETRDDSKTKKLGVGTSATLPSKLEFRVQINADDTQFLLVEVGKLI